jgi:hypothetical protein
MIAATCKTWISELHKIDGKPVIGLNAILPPMGRTRASATARSISAAAHTGINICPVAPPERAPEVNLGRAGKSLKHVGAPPIYCGARAKGAFTIVV